MENIISINNSLRRKFILLFVILIGVTLAASIFLFVQAGQITGAGAASGAIDLQSFRLALQRNIVMAALFITSGLLFAMFYFLRLVIFPLEELKRSTLKLADGQLDALEHPVATTNGPIKAIMENIHDLAINLQEVLLLVWNSSAGDLDIIEQTTVMLKASEVDEHRDEILENLEFLHGHLVDKQELVQQFDFFNVTIQGKKVFAEDESADQ